jgi:hypothetical protein
MKKKAGNYNDFDATELTGSLLIRLLTGSFVETKR